MFETKSSGTFKTKILFKVYAFVSTHTFSDILENVCLCSVCFCKLPWTSCGSQKKMNSRDGIPVGFSLLQFENIGVVVFTNPSNDGGAVCKD